MCSCGGNAGKRIIPQHGEDHEEDEGHFLGRIVNGELDAEPDEKQCRKRMNLGMYIVFL